MYRPAAYAASLPGPARPAGDPAAAGTLTIPDTPNAAAMNTNTLRRLRLTTLPYVSGAPGGTVNTDGAWINNSNGEILRNITTTGQRALGLFSALLPFPWVEVN